MQVRLLCSLLLLPLCIGQPCSSYPNAWVLDGFCASSYATDLPQARGLFLDTTLTQGDLLVVARGYSVPAVVAVWGSTSAARAVLVSQAGLNHGVTVAEKAGGGGHYLYASTSDAVYRWPYTPGQRSSLGDGELIVTRISLDSNGNQPGGHTTRTLMFDAQARLYISVGSAGNIDGDSYRSRIRRFRGMTAEGPLTPVEFSTGEVFADGVRNEVGLALDPEGDAVWGVENGPDQLSRPDIGNDINNDAVAEELNRFPIDSPGLFYGYPYCWSEYSLPNGAGLGKTSQWSWPSGAKSDAWCRDTANVQPPTLAMQAHSAPLGMAFFKGASCSQCDATCQAAGTYEGGERGGFPCSHNGDLFVPFHGSWNRNPATGYKVVRIPFTNNMPAGQPEDFLKNDGSSAKWPNNMRPVDVAFDARGRMFVSSDTTNEVLLISFTNVPASSAPSGDASTGDAAAATNDPATTTGETVCCPGTPSPDAVSLGCTNRASRGGVVTSVVAAAAALAAMSV